MGSSMSMVCSSQHSARRSACEGGKAGSRFLKMVLVCSILEMSKEAGPNSLGVGTRIGSVLAVSMTLRHRSSHRLSEFALSSASDGGGSRSSVSSKGCWEKGWGGAGRGGGVGKAAAGAGVGGLLTLLRAARDGGCDCCPGCCCGQDCRLS